MGILRNVALLLRVYSSYLRRKETLAYPPLFIGIETSGVCNLRCVMCPHGQPDKHSARGLMSLEIFRAVVDEAREFAFDADLFGGGEPLLHPRIFDMVDYARQAGIRTRLHTNATVLTEERARNLLESGLDYLSLSFDGYTKQCYERTRLGANYEQTLANITSFLAQKQKAARRRPYVVLQAIEDRAVALAPAERTAKEELRRSLAALSLDEFRVIQVHNYGGKVAASGGSGGHYSPCTFPYYATYVLWDGTIVPCCVDWWGEYALGRIGESTLLEAWRGERIVALRHLLAKRRYREVSLCRSCDRLWRSTRLGVPQRSARIVRQFIGQHLLGY